MADTWTGRLPVTETHLHLTCAPTNHLQQLGQFTTSVFIQKLPDSKHTTVHP